MGLSNAETVEKVLAGGILSKPNDCPDEVYDIMKSCWKQEPEDRPQFQDLFQSISALIGAEEPQPTQNKHEADYDSPRVDPYNYNTSTNDDP